MIAAGLDVGRKRDRSAFVMLSGNLVFYAVAIRGLSLPEQKEWVEASPFKPDLIAVDATGIGLGLAEGGLGVPVLAVTITGRRHGPVNTRIVTGDIEEREVCRGVNVGKLRLVGLVAEALRERKLSVAPTCLGRDMLRRELEAMVIKHTATGRMQAEAGHGHDDLVMALALALLARDMLEGGYGNGQRQAA